MDDLYKNQTKLYQSYEQTIRTKFDSLPTDMRKTVLGTMESFLSRVVMIDRPIHDLENVEFDSSLAAKVRKTKGLSQKKLDEQLDIPKNSIARWEIKQRKIDSTSVHKPNARKYLGWLADNGYDPYHLKE